MGNSARKAGTVIGDYRAINSSVEMASVDVAIWDFDGALADTEPWQMRAYAAVLDDWGVTMDSSLAEQLVGNSDLTNWGALIERFKLTESPETLRARRREILLQWLPEAAPPNWFVLPLLAAWRDRGTPSVVVSSGNTRFIEDYLKYWHLLDAFDDVSGTVDQSTPKKAARLTQALEHHGRAAVVEDSPRYIALSSAAGAVTYGVEHRFNRGELRAANFLLPTDRPEDTP